MKIIVDAMGGDNAPKEILLGAAAAVREYGVQITAVGRRRDIEACARENGIDMARTFCSSASRRRSPRSCVRTAWRTPGI